MTLLSCILLALGVWALGIQVLGQLAVFWLVGRSPRRVPHHSWGVSVLKPLKGSDPELEANLRSMFEQDWSKLEIVFGAADPDDPALGVARELSRQYPEVATRVVTSLGRVGLNPKVNLLAELSAQASHDLLLICDAGVRAPRDYVERMVESFSQPNTGLVSSPLVGFGATTHGGAIDNLILNLFVLRAVCFAKLFVRHSCVIGKSMMFRLSDLRRLGGWHAVADVLAEDYVLGRLFRRAGFDVRLSPTRLPTRTHCNRLQDGIDRHLRWCQMRRRTSAFAYLAELGANVSIWALALIMTAWIAEAPSNVFMICGMLLLIAKLTVDVASMLWLTPQGVGWPVMRWMPLTDFVNFWIWLRGAVQRTVDWRGTRLLIGQQTRLAPLASGGRAGTGTTYSTMTTN